MSANARTRADVDIHAKANLTANILDRYPTDSPVEILEDKDGWYKIKPVRLQATASGYVPRAGLIFPVEPQTAVFPQIPFKDGTLVINSVPRSLKLSEFQAWQAGHENPPWIPEYVWEGYSNDLLRAVRESMLSSINADQVRWDNWVSAVTNNGRLDEAVMDEWVAIVEGGREVYAIRDHYIYKQPVQDANYYGCACQGQVMRWTGQVKHSDQGGAHRDFYEVQFFRMSREMNGWFRADLAAEYVYPTYENDPQVASNAQNVFDLSIPALRFPQDPEIAAAKAAGYVGAQYIDVYAATGKHLRHFCLCGEFCVACLDESDIIPILKNWKDVYSRATSILNDAHQGTSASDLSALLGVASLQGEIYSSAPTTPQLIKERLSSGQYAISGCGINSGGTVLANGSIRHWVVLEDILPVGNNGWVRIYNPFHNREEVYAYDLFIKSAGTGTGLWVTPKS